MSVNDSSELGLRTQFIGYAYDLETGELQYQEQHSRIVRADQTLLKTLYTTPDGVVIARREVVSEKNKVVRLRLDDELNQTVNRVERGDQALQLLSSGKGTEKSKNLSGPKVDSGVIDAGFNHFVRAQWGRLLAGEKVDLDFLSIEHSRFVRLRLRHKGTEYEAGAKIEKFSMIAVNPLIRLLMSSIEIEYYADIKELRQYRGISNLKQANGRNYRVRIEFPRAGYIVVDGE